jgi:hypothetical protein
VKSQEKEVLATKGPLETYKIEISEIKKGIEASGFRFNTLNYMKMI